MALSRVLGKGGFAPQVLLGLLLLSQNHGATRCCCHPIVSCVELPPVTDCPHELSCVTCDKAEKGVLTFPRGSPKPHPSRVVYAPMGSLFGGASSSGFSLGHVLFLDPDISRGGWSTGGLVKQLQCWARDSFFQPKAMGLARSS